MAHTMPGSGGREKRGTSSGRGGQPDVHMGTRRRAAFPVHGAEHQVGRSPRFAPTRFSIGSWPSRARSSCIRLLIRAGRAWPDPYSRPACLAAHSGDPLRRATPASTAPPAGGGGSLTVVDIEQVLGFRLARSGLARRSARSLAEAATCPASDFSRDAALFALAARHEDVSREQYEKAAD